MQNRWYLVKRDESVAILGRMRGREEVWMFIVYFSGLLRYIVRAYTCPFVAVLFCLLVVDILPM